MLLALALGAATACRPFLTSGFDIAPGDIGDARIMVFLLESTRRALLAGHSILSPPMFAPQPGVLGYTDAHLLWLAPYSLLRLLGLDMVRAFSALVVAVLAWGCLSGWWLLHRTLRLDSRAAAVGAYLFAFGSPMQMQLNHAQMIGICLLPAILLLLHHAWRSDRLWPALTAGLLTGLLAATSYVATWFFLFFSLLAAIAGLVLEPRLRQALRQPPLLRLLAALAVGLALGLLPFAAIYGDFILHGARRSPGDANFYRPLGSDLFNLGPNHPVWGGLLGWFGIPVANPDTMAERAMGASPPVWVLAVAGAVLLWRRRHQARPEERMLLLAAIGAAVGTALEFRYGRGLWAWMAVYLTVPGAAAIRNPFRSQLVAELALSGLLAVALDQVLRRGLVVLFAPLAALAVLAAAFQHPPANWRASQQQAALRGLPSPPPGCAVFAIAPQPEGGPPGWQLRTEALMLALHWRLPTMNGDSSWTPEGWRLTEPAAPDYPAALAAWVRRHSIAGNSCLYDPAGKRWLSPAAQAEILG